jgi:hypothetical protein
MPGGVQTAAIRQFLERGIIPVPAGRFEPVGDRGTRVRCVLCHHPGYGPVEPTPHTASPWQINHLMPHLYPCRCGMRFAAPWHLAIHITPRRGFTEFERREDHGWAVPDA